jgi:deazaflavin-dependent oxidoreductase (nitroreductase family)
MHFPRSLARFNKVVTNPIQGIWAGRVVPWIIMLHTGRTSGRHYRTPMMAWKRGDLVLIVLFYGEQSNWLRNVLAADGAEFIRAGRRYRLRNPHVVKTAGRDDLSPTGRLLTRPFGGVALVAEAVPIPG